MTPNKELEPLQLPESVVFLKLIFNAERHSSVSFILSCGCLWHFLVSCGALLSSRVSPGQAGKPGIFNCNTCVTERTQLPEKQGREGKFIEVQPRREATSKGEFTFLRPM